MVNIIGSKLGYACEPFHSHEQAVSPSARAEDRTVALNVPGAPVGLLRRWTRALPDGERARAVSAVPAIRRLGSVVRLG